MKKQIRESLTCDRCMKEVREFQVSLVSKFPEFLWNLNERELHGIMQNLQIW